jgi:hypothetical protein
MPVLAQERDYSPDRRKELAKQGKALPGGSYPIPDKGALKDAIQAYGRAKNKAAAKRHIIKRARALGATDMLPADWKEGVIAEPAVHEVREMLQLEAYEALQTGEDGRRRAKMTLIRAGMSANRRNYRASALEAAANAGKYNGLRMFVDHSEKPPLKRSLNEVVSGVESSQWNSANQTVEGTVVFFDDSFADKVEKAKSFVGVSVNNLIRASRQPQADGTVMEDVQSIERVHSVDWVIYPAAGGELQHFLESEEGDGMAIDWTKITADDLKKNAPAIVKLLQEETNPPDDDDEEEDTDDTDSGSGANGEDKPEPVTKESIAQMIAQGIAQHDREIASAAEKQRAAASLVQAHLDKSGLPQVVRARMARTFATMPAAAVTESAVTESITEAKEELKALKVGPQITGMGPSGSQNNDTSTRRVSVRESVESFFAGPKKKTTDGASEGAK